MTNKSRSSPRTPEVCPVCGEDVPRAALACPECGADHNSGWKDDAEFYDGVDLPDPEFNYDEFVRREFGKKGKPAGLRGVWWIAGIVLIIAFLLIYFHAAR